MTAIQSIDEYLSLLRQSKEKCNKTFTNSYISIEEIKRYINLGNLFYIWQDNGIFFLCDEKKYYRLLYWLEPKSRIFISKQDKPIAIRNVYKEEKKKEELLFLDACLGELGFINEYTAIEMCIPTEEGNAIEKQKNIYERFLKKGKFHIEYMKENDIEHMLKLRETEEFHIYNFKYKTREEYCNEIKNNQYWAVYDERNIMRACIYTEPVFAAILGDGICVEKDYRNTYGLGAALMLHVLDQAVNINKKRYVSWCELENVNSMKFHENIGFRKTGKISDEWVIGER